MLESQTPRWRTGVGEAPCNGEEADAAATDFTPRNDPLLPVMFASLSWGAALSIAPTHALSVAECPLHARSFEFVISFGPWACSSAVYDHRRVLERRQCISPREQ